MPKLKFVKQKKEPFEIEKKVYKVLVVDDDQSIHEITNLALNSMKFSDFGIEIFSAYTAKEAREILKTNKDIALALIDVVMETPEAGLELVNYIRNDMKNSLIRLIIRTGQANEFPAMDVIQNYDINDFKAKTELTLEHLYTTVRTSIKQYIQLMELQKKYEDTYLQMTTNSLTKLPNRIKMNEDCDNSKHKTLILIDIIGFGEINTTNGYDVGDFVLCELGGFLQNMYSDKFKIYHINSDLFALVHISSDEIEDLFTIVETIKEDISRLHMITDNFNKTIDTRIGVAYQDETNLMRKAELALKEAHTKGKSKIQYYSQDLKIIKRINETNKWAPIIKNGLQNGGIFANYQAIYDMKTMDIEKYELLVRLESDGKVHAPIEFLKAAHHSGQLYDIFKFMFETACEKVKSTGSKFSVNIGTVELKYKGILDFIKQTIAKYEIQTSLLSLELLEYTSIDKEIKEIILEIHKLGIKIIIDDFGVQCSNFGQIEDLPIDILKIDGSFIKTLTDSQNSQIIVKTIKTFADAKNIKLVAEFVCDEDVYKIVKELGIDYGQGYYLGKPEKEPTA